ncbi:hypothetical protein N6L24_09810 [Cognatishimia sp. SS12]|uniref:hypothetical protein n=1 Tax=Cognatishimia sp. SS12 TaxID=2979465 RepID=UPI002330F709|nr:hypothetical protein [Cognatishimia sp. SS12]MDC0738576.1 hypothetical protein [Cognatishimia sp. SS12]
MLSQRQFHRIYRLSAWYDLIVTWPFATPITLALFWSSMGTAHDALGLAPLPALDTYAVLFANFFGTVVLIWSVLRLRLNDVRLARYDAVGRWSFSAWQLYALSQGASPILWGFLIAEVIWAILQSLPLRKEATAAQSA